MTIGEVIDRLVGLTGIKKEDWQVRVVTSAYINQLRARLTKEEMYNLNNWYRYYPNRNFIVTIGSSACQLCYEVAVKSDDLLSNGKRILAQEYDYKLKFKSGKIVAKMASGVESFVINDEKISEKIKC